MSPSTQDIDRLEYNALRCASSPTSIAWLLRIVEAHPQDHEGTLGVATHFLDQLTGWRSEYESTRTPAVVSAVCRASDACPAREPIMPFLPHNNKEYASAVFDAVQHLMFQACRAITEPARLAGLMIAESRITRNGKGSSKKYMGGLRQRLARTVELYPLSEVLCKSIKVECEAARRLVGQDDPAPSEKTYLVREAIGATLFSRDMLHDYATDAGVPTAGRGGRNFRWTEAQLVAILRHIETNSSSVVDANKARKAIEAISSRK